MTKPAYGPAQRSAWRLALLAKGRDISDRLAELLAGKEVDLQDLADLRGGRPGERPEERLRRLLDVLMAALHTLDTPDFGRCASCGDLLPVAELDAMPWADTCRRCAAGAPA